MSAPETTEALVLALAESISLSIPEEALPGVVAFYETAKGHADILDRVELDDGTLDLAPVYRLVGEMDDVV